MSSNQFQKDLGSYVSFALKVKPDISFSGSYNEKGTYVRKAQKLKLPNPDKLSAKEVGSIEELVARYQMLKKYLPPKSSLSKLKITPGHIDPEEKPMPGVKYRKVSVNANQFEIAKTVAEMVGGIHSLYIKGDHQKAKARYLDFQNYMAVKRADLIGQFRTVTELEDTMGMYGIGLNGGIRPADKLYWLPVFIVIEVWIG